MSVDPEDYVERAKAIARYVHRKSPGDLEEYISDALEWTVRLARDFDPDGPISFDQRLGRVLPWRILDGRRLRRGHGRARSSVIDARPVALGDRDPATREPTPEDVAVWADLRRDILALPARLRLVAVAASYKGGLTDLANRDGVTQGAITCRLRALRHHLARHRPSAEA